MYKRSRVELRKPICNSTSLDAAEAVEDLPDRNVIFGGTKAFLRHSFRRRDAASALENLGGRVTPLTVTKLSTGT